MNQFKGFLFGVSWSAFMVAVAYDCGPGVLVGWVCMWLSLMWLTD